MVDNDYTLEGRFEIANENMKQEMNELIIQILYKQQQLEDDDCNDQWSGVRCS